MYVFVLSVVFSLFRLVAYARTLIHLHVCTTTGPFDMTLDPIDISWLE